MTLYSTRSAYHLQIPRPSLNSPLPKPHTSPP